MVGGAGRSEQDIALTQTQFPQLFFFTGTCLVCVVCLLGATHILQTGLVFVSDKFPVMFFVVFFQPIVDDHVAFKINTAHGLPGVARSCTELH